VSPCSMLDVRGMRRVLARPVPVSRLSTPIVFSGAAFPCFYPWPPCRTGHGSKSNGSFGHIFSPSPRAPRAFWLNPVAVPNSRPPGIGSPNFLLLPCFFFFSPWKHVARPFPWYINDSFFRVWEFNPLPFSFGGPPVPLLPVVPHTRRSRNAPRTQPQHHSFFPPVCCPCASGTSPVSLPHKDDTSSLLVRFFDFLCLKNFCKPFLAVPSGSFGPSQKTTFRPVLLRGVARLPTNSSRFGFPLFLFSTPFNNRMRRTPHLALFFSFGLLY